MEHALGPLIPSPPHSYLSLPTSCLNVHFHLLNYLTTPLGLPGPALAYFVDLLIFCPSPPLEWKLHEDKGLLHPILSHIAYGPGHRLAHSRGLISTHLPWLMWLSG